MPAATAKKPTAYREGRADKTKKPSIEVEIAPEGEEEEEGMEGQEMDAAKTNRKRSAKGAKHTKAPMDGDCGCGGGKGKKCTCDGGCGGGYAKKMDRSDALTPQEYLAACELGIQGRSRSYIRARLDAAERLDLKCGKGSISQGEKCTKGAAQKIDPKTRKGLTGKGLLTAGLAVGGGYLALKHGRSVANEVKEIGGSVKSLMEKKAKLRAVQAQNKKMGLEGEGENNFTRFLDRVGPDKRRKALERAFQKPAAKRPRRDSVYAAGFSTELDQLAI